ncbi:collagenase [Pseudoalteromonas sp. T1lg65]|uniref:collagenase n=1 Tax=Pseudoalteromonas sp. T1lg65 TaxID=2077101 RepID=UPI003F7AC75A
MKIKAITLAVALASGTSFANTEQTTRYFEPQQVATHAVEDISHGHEAHARDSRAPIAVRVVDQSHAIRSILSSNKVLSAFSNEIVATNCDLNALAAASSSQIVNAITTQGGDCINDLFNAASGIQQQVFTNSKMLAAAEAAQSRAQQYVGGGDADLQALFLFIRAGFYVEFYNDNVSFSDNIQSEVKLAIDAFTGNEHFYDNNDAHGKLLGEVITTMDSSELQHAYLPIVKTWLQKWNPDYAQNWNMRRAVNGIFTILFRGQWNNEFVKLIENDQQLVTLLEDFTTKSWMIGSDSEYLIVNAASELARLKTYTGTPIQPEVDKALKALFERYESYGYGDAIWLAAADVASYYADCSVFGICGFENDLESKVLGQRHSCSDTIKVRAQELTALQLSSACDTMAAEETRFHSMLETGRQPVGDDNNSFLQVNIFNSSADYKKYAKAIFKIDTNNGGMYLEGDPSRVGNVANFVAYEADYAKADHYIWNLEHEYVHYLDGRFDLYGDFNAPTKAIVWWSEGVAEYIANLNDNQDAIDTIKDGSTYRLTDIFATTYDGFDQDRIYRWGYLAVRFMFERHFDEVKAMLAETRVGNWNAYQSRMDKWAAEYDSEFTQWTQDLAGGVNNAPIAVINGPYNGDIISPIQFSSAGSGDPDGDAISYRWNFGDGSQSSEASPQYQYASAGEYTVTLTVTDSRGLSHQVTTQALVEGNSSNELENGVAIAIEGEQNEEQFYTITVPSGAKQLAITLSGGSGDADLYVRAGQAPNKDEYDCRPYKNGNDESCIEAQPQATTYYVMVRGYNAYAGVSLKASYQIPSTIADACQTQAPVSSGRLTAGQTVCMASQEPMWFSLENMSGQQSVVIETAHGSGDLGLEYSNQGWPNGNNVDASSFNQGNGECIELGSQTNFWGYLKVTGAPSGAAIKVSYNEGSCQ